MRTRLVGLALMSCLLLCTMGCNDNTDTGTDTGTGTGTGTVTPNQPDPTIVGDIQYGTSATVTLALSVIKNQAEAQKIATLSQQAIEGSILPILNGSDQGILAGLNDILALKAFDNPTLSKVKLILETALPLLMNHIPGVHNLTDKVPPDVKAYLIAFFTGADTGCTNFLGVAPPPTAQKVKGLSVPDLIKKLNQ